MKTNRLFDPCDEFGHCVFKNVLCCGIALHLGYCYDKSFFLKNDNNDRNNRVMCQYEYLLLLYNSNQQGF